MDYEVFLLGRVKEARDSGLDDAAAVASGLGSTGRIVTAAAALMSVTFLAFATSKVSFIQMLGLGCALAILLDATLVRGVLVPALMRLMGRWNWWAPGPLVRLHERIAPASEARRASAVRPAPRSASITSAI
jgi:RND superfamily putative drug exporter